jgi:hypothetical protein
MQEVDHSQGRLRGAAPRTCSPLLVSSSTKLRSHCSSSSGGSLRSKMWGVDQLEVLYTWHWVLVVAIRCPWPAGGREGGQAGEAASWVQPRYAASARPLVAMVMCCVCASSVAQLTCTSALCCYVVVGHASILQGTPPHHSPPPPTPT